MGILEIDPTLSLLDNYYWDASVCYMAQYEARMVHCLVPGLGMLVNSHPSLINAQPLHHPHTEQQHRGYMSRLIDHGAGATSEYYGFETRAAQNIQKGSEIFVSYGSEWFPERPEYAELPIKMNYDKADHIIKSFIDSQVGKSDLKSSQEGWNTILNVMNSLDRRTRAAMPEDVGELSHAAEIGTARFFLPNFIRSMEWLRQNGQCMDNLIFGKSVISQAGQGAFATRFISKGDLIAPAPLIHIDKDVLAMHRKINENDMIVEGDQLLLNYCFGHPKSSLLLFPYSSTVQFINHSSKKANAKIQWSTSALHQQQWLSDPLEEVKSRDKTGLMFDIIATRDVALGEEVLLDYGHDWVASWEDHLQGQIPQEHNFETASALNKDRDSAVKTLQEQLSDPYLPDVEITCIFEYEAKDDGKEEGENGLRYILKQWNLGLHWGIQGGKHHRPCDILSRKRFGKHYFYTARVYNYDIMYEEQKIPDSSVLVVTKIPRWAIQFTEKSYSSNQHYENSFRQPITIPDDLLPSHWLDL